MIQTSISKSKAASARQPVIWRTVQRWEKTDIGVRVSLSSLQHNRRIYWWFYSYKTFSIAFRTWLQIYIYILLIYNRYFVLCPMVFLWTLIVLLLSLLCFFHITLIITYIISIFICEPDKFKLFMMNESGGTLVSSFCITDFFFFMCAK